MRFDNDINSSHSHQRCSPAQRIAVVLFVQRSARVPLSTFTTLWYEELRTNKPNFCSPQGKPNSSICASSAYILMRSKHNEHIVVFERIRHINKSTIAPITRKTDQASSSRVTADKLSHLFVSFTRIVTSEQQPENVPLMVSLIAASREWTTISKRKSHHRETTKSVQKRKFSVESTTVHGKADNCLPQDN